MYPTPAHKRRKAQDLSKFLGLVGTPGNLVAGLTLPANARLYASSSSVLATASPVVTIKGSTYSIGPGPADVPRLVQFAECGVTVAKAAGAPGTVSLYIEGNLGKLLKIAQG